MENSKEKQETKRSIKISESTHTKMSDIKGYYGISFTKQVDIAIRDYYEKMKNGTFFKVFLGFLCYNIAKTKRPFQKKDNCNETVLCF